MEPQNPYEKVVKKFLLLLGLLIASPIVFSIALKAKRLYTEGTGSYISIILTITGAVLLVYTVYFGFKTFQLLINTIFNDKN